MTTPRRHHYLPISYQARWLVDKSFILRDAASGRTRSASPPSTGVERDYYKIVYGSGATEFGVEGLLAEIESKAKDAIDHLMVGHDLNESQKYELAFFVAFLRSRVPTFMEEFDRSAAAMLKERIRTGVPDAASAAAWLAKQTDLPEHLRRYSPEEVVRMLHGDGYRIRVPAAYRILASMRAAIALGPEIGTLHWDIGESPKGKRFITSDNPVCIGVTWHRSLPIGVTTYEVPLSPTLVLKTGLPGETIRRKTLAESEVAAVNRRVATGSARFTIAASEDDFAT
jgi:Protein of unknown function (DUF4238)